MSESPIDNAPDLELSRLFLSDLISQLETLNAQPATPPEKETLEIWQQTLHAIWGGARLANCVLAETLSTGLRDWLKAFKSNKQTWLPQHQQILEAGLSWLNALAEQPAEQLADWLQSQVTVVENLSQQLSQDLNVAAPATTPATTPATLVQSATAQNPENATPKTAPPQLQQQNTAKTTLAPKAINAPSVALPKVDSSLLMLFLNELETHSDILSEELLALETHPESAELLETLMRSAHSIKGGARVINLDNVVTLAHHMEDCFVAAQEDKILFTPEAIDFLLHSVDMLKRMGQAIETKDAAQWGHVQGALAPMVTGLRQICAGELVAASSAPVTTAAPVTATETTETQPQVTAVPQVLAQAETSNNNLPEKTPNPTTSEDRTVRVTAKKIERLVGFAGEVVVSASWLPSFNADLLALKRSHMEISTELEQLQNELITQRADTYLIKQAIRIREKNKECTHYLGEQFNALDSFTSNFSTHADRLYREMIGVRMRPFADGAKGFPRMVRDLARSLGKKVKFEIIGKSTEVDQDIQEKLDAPLNHLLRNALDHGIENPEQRLAAGKPEVAKLTLEASHRSGMLMLSLSDDGCGINPTTLKQKILDKGLAGEEIIRNLTESELLDFLFLPGFSTSQNVTEISGRGVGLDVVHSMVHEVGGVVRAENHPGHGLKFHLELPLTLSVIRTFLVEIAGEPYAFPLARIERCLNLKYEDIELVEDRQYFRFNDNNIALVNIHDILELDTPPAHKEAEISVVVVSDRFSAYGLAVDRFIGEYDLVVRPLDPRLGTMQDISAVSIMLDGTPVLIFDVEDLVHSIDKLLRQRRLRQISKVEDQDFNLRRKHILVVDDSITVRETERKLLENQGYRVDVAVDGMDGWNAVRSDNYDLVVSDVDMPRLNGIELVNRIRQTESLARLPVIIVSYKDSEKHRMQGMEAGANYYLTKSSFEDDSFLGAVIDLIGETV